MKKTRKTMAIATAFALGTLLVGCEPKTEQPQEVYGPPTSTTEVIQNVYGPPTATKEEKKTEKQTTEAITEYDPSTEVPEDYPQ